MSQQVLLSVHSCAQNLHNVQASVQLENFLNYAQTHSNERARLLDELHFIIGQLRSIKDTTAETNFRTYLINVYNSGTSYVITDSMRANFQKLDTLSNQSQNIITTRLQHAMI